MNSKKISKKTGWIFAFCYACLVIGLCQLFMHDFFNVDDTLNEMLGFSTQYGRIWSEGHVPFIVDTLFVGGNSMVELGKGVFLPQNIVASLLAYHFDYIRLPGLFLALLNITLLTYSAWVIARECHISSRYAYVFAAFAAIQPVFLYQYSAGWWNAADGQAWATAAVATFLVLRNRMTARNFVLHFLSVVCLLAAGWPHGVIGYAVFVLVTLVYQWICTKQIKPILWLAVPGLLALLFVVPIYSEYVFSGSLIDRPSGFYNDGRFLSPAWSSIVMGFFPAYYEYMHYFGGYRLMLVPFGFSILLLPAALFYRQIGVLWRASHIMKWLVALVAVFFLLTQMPTQFGPLRYPFRFLPFLSLALCLFTCYVLDKAPQTKGRRCGYVLVVLMAGLLAVMAGLGVEIEAKHIALQILSVGLLLLVPWLLYRANAILMVGSVVLCLLIMLAGIKSLGYKERYVAFPKLPQILGLVSGINGDGFVLSLTSHPNRRYLNDLNSAQFGVYNIKAINGYSPVGNKALDALLPHDSPHAIFKSDETLKHVLQVTQWQPACQAEVMRISTLLMQQADYDRHKSALAGCGYTLVQALPKSDVAVSLPKTETQGWAHNPPFVWPQSVAGSVRMITHGNNTDILVLSPTAQVRSLIFPRVWWPGYSATLNGQPLPVTRDDTGALVRINIPSGASGNLRLSYFPYTWHYIWPAPVVALIGLALIVWMRRKASVVLSE